MDQGFSLFDDPPLSISRLTPADIRQTSYLHRYLLPYGFFPQLGAGFVRRWHLTFVDSSYGVAFVAKDRRGVIQGFLLASTDQARYTADVLLTSRVALGWRATLALTVRPRLAVHFLRSRAVRYMRRTRSASIILPGQSTVRERLPPPSSPDPIRSRAVPPTPLKVVGVVHAIVTVPSWRGRGVGRALLAAYDRELIALQTPLLQLVTREAGDAAEFYRRLGYRQTDRRLDRDGTPIVQFDRVPGAQ